MIEADKLTRAYGAFKAVESVSFRIERGEVVGLLGHNGAGKSTIMKMLTGFLEPSSGSIRIDGLDMVSALSAVQSRIGYLPENCPVWPEMTVIDLLDYQAALHGMGPAERPRAVRAAIERTRLADRAEQTIGTLSRGYRQRVGVAQAILHRPKVLILDEPTNGLDPAQIHHMRALIRELAREATVILSTHILQEVEAVCDRVIILRAGRVAVDARLDALAVSNRLCVEVSGAVEAAPDVVSALAGVRAVVSTPVGEGRVQLLLEVDGDSAAVAPEVVRSLSGVGLSIHRVEPERRDLERVFREVNEADAEAAGEVMEVAGHA